MQPTDKGDEIINVVDNLLDLLPDVTLASLCKHTGYNRSNLHALASRRNHQFITDSKYSLGDWYLTMGTNEQWQRIKQVNELLNELTRWTHA